LVEKVGFRKVNAATICISKHGVHIVGGKPVFIAAQRPLWPPFYHLKASTNKAEIGNSRKRKILLQGRRIMRKIGARGARK